MEVERPTKEELMARLKDMVPVDDSSITSCVSQESQDVLRFQVSPSDMDYSNQYYKLYCTRLAVLRESLLQGLSQEQQQKVEKVLHIQQDREYLLIGTVMKEMKARISVFDKEQRQVQPNQNYCQDDDVVYLDDETGKVNLDSQGLGHLLTHGAVVCLRGTFRDTQYKIQEVIGHHSIEPMITQPISPQIFLNEASSLVLLCSGLDVHQEQLMKSLQNLLCGHSVSPLASLISSKLSDLLILGKLVDPSHSAAPGSSDLLANEVNTNAHLQTSLSAHQISANYELLDIWLEPIASKIKVSVLPSGRDLSTAFWPMPSLPSFLLPRASAYGLNMLTNPARLSLAGHKTICSDGENIRDIMRYTEYSPGQQEQDCCVAMAQTLFWNHLVPTAPDTLRCHPLSHSDPLVLCPADTNGLRLMLAGNMPHGQNRSYQLGRDRVTMVGVPSFCNAGEVVVMNPSSGESLVLSLLAL